MKRDLTWLMLWALWLATQSVYAAIDGFRTAGQSSECVQTIWRVGPGAALPAAGMAGPPGWTVKTADLGTWKRFIDKRYPWFSETYEGYTDPGIRALALRYFLLYHYGGVVIDASTVPTGPLTTLACDQGTDVILSYSESVTEMLAPLELGASLPLSDRVLISRRPKHPFFIVVFALLQQRAIDLKALAGKWKPRHERGAVTKGSPFPGAKLRAVDAWSLQMARVGNLTITDAQDPTSSNFRRAVSYLVGDGMLSEAFNIYTQAAHVLDGVELLGGVLQGLREGGQLPPKDTYGDVLNRVSLLPCGQLVPCQAPH